MSSSTFKACYHPSLLCSGRRCRHCTYTVHRITHLYPAPAIALSLLWVPCRCRTSSVQHPSLSSIILCKTNNFARI
ncbi:hypothetical protein I3842_13G142600 [Carya illinoinensis]|uniref:Uncharacterized protein n=1 Tax=Carya illinoinensis TaxID=32201 RepID=A0A922DD53_CARIL|nr:hypothetical protein I3842_13G142600 [Carya illinoinensis]